MRSTLVTPVASTSTSTSTSAQAESITAEKLSNVEILKTLGSFNSYTISIQDLENVTELQMAPLSEKEKEKERLLAARCMRNWQEAKTYLGCYLAAEQLYKRTYGDTGEGAFIMAQKIAQNELGDARKFSKVDHTPLCLKYYLRAFLDKQPLALIGLINYFAQQENKFAHEAKQELMRLQSQRLVFPLHHSVTINSLIKIIDLACNMVHFPELKIILGIELLQGIAARSLENYESKLNLEAIQTMDALFEQIKAFCEDITKHSKKELRDLSVNLEEKLVVVKIYQEELQMLHQKMSAPASQLDDFADSVDLSPFNFNSPTIGADCEKFICNIAMKLPDAERAKESNVQSLKENCYQKATQMSIEYAEHCLTKNADPKKAFECRNLFNLSIDRAKFSDLVLLLKQQQAIINANAQDREFSLRELLTLLVDLLNKIEENPEILPKDLPSICYDYLQVIVRCMQVIDVGFSELKLTMPQFSYLRDSCIRLRARLDLHEFSAKADVLLGALCNTKWFGKMSLEDFVKSSHYYLSAFFQGEIEGMQGLKRLFEREEKSRKSFQKGIQICKLLEVKDLSLTTELTCYRTLFQEFSAIAHSHFGVKETVSMPALFELRKLMIEFLLTKINNNSAFSKKEFQLFKDFIIEMELQQPKGSSDITLLKNKFLQIYTHFEKEEHASINKAEIVKKCETALEVATQIEQDLQTPIVGLAPGSDSQQQIASVLAGTVSSLQKATAAFGKVTSRFDDMAQLQSIYEIMRQLELEALAKESNELITKENNFLPLCLEIIDISKTLSETQQETVKPMIGYAHFMLGKHYLKKFETDKRVTSCKKNILKTAILHFDKAQTYGEFDACIYLQKTEEIMVASGANPGRGYVEFIIRGLALKKSKLQRFSTTEKDMLYGLLLTHWYRTSNYGFLYLIAESIHHLKPILLNHALVGGTFILGQMIAQRELDGEVQQSGKVDKTVLGTVYYLRELLSSSPLGLTGLINYYRAQNTKAANAICQELLNFRSYCFVGSIEEPHIVNHLVNIIKSMSKAANSIELKIILFAEVVFSLTPFLQAQPIINEELLQIIETLFSQIQSFIADGAKHTNTEQQSLASHLEEKLKTTRQTVKELRARVKNQGVFAVNPAKTAVPLNVETVRTATEFEAALQQSIDSSSWEDRLANTKNLTDNYFKLGFHFFKEYLKERSAGNTDTDKLFKAEKYTTFGLDRNKISNFMDFLSIALSILRRESKLEVYYRVLIESLTFLFNALEENPAMTSTSSPEDYLSYTTTVLNCLEITNRGLSSLEISLPPQFNRVRDQFVRWASEINAGVLQGEMHLKLGKALAIDAESSFLRASFYYLSAFFHGEQQGIQQLINLFNTRASANSSYKLGEKICQAIELDKRNKVFTHISLLRYKELFQVFNSIARSSTHPKNAALKSDELFALQKLVLAFLLVEVRQLKADWFSQKEFLVLKELIEYVEQNQPIGSTDITLLKKQFLQDYADLSKTITGKKIADDLLPNQTSSRPTGSKSKNKGHESNKTSKKAQKKKTTKTTNLTTTNSTLSVVKAVSQTNTSETNVANSQSLTSKDKKQRKREEEKKEKKRQKALEKTKKKRSKLKAQQRALQKRPDICQFDESTYLAQVLEAQQIQRKQAEEEAEKLKNAEAVKEMEKIKEEERIKAEEKTKAEEKAKAEERKKLAEKITQTQVATDRFVQAKPQTKSTLVRSMSTMFYKRENQPSRIPVAPTAAQPTVAAMLASISTSSAPSPIQLTQPIIVPLNDQVRTILAKDPQNNRVVGGFVRESVKQMNSAVNTSGHVLDTSDVDFTFFAPQPTTNFPIPPYTFEYRESNKKVFFKCKEPEMDISFSDKRTLYADAKTRDFTINALYLKLRDDGMGEVEDPLGLAFEDLKYKLIRFINSPEQVLKDDPIVIFRFLELIVKGYRPVDKIDANYLKQFYQYLDNPKKITSGQIYHRLIKACLKGRATASMDLFLTYGLFQKLFPQIAESQYDWVKLNLQSLDERTQDTGQLDVAAFFAILIQAALRSIFTASSYTDAGFDINFRWLILQFRLPKPMQTKLEAEYTTGVRLQVKEYLGIVERKALPVAPIRLSHHPAILHRSTSQFISKPRPDLDSVATEWVPKRPG